MQPGDTVKIGGKEVQIVTRHASGKHVQFGLSDGTSAVDLHLRGDVVKVQKEVPVVKKDSGFQHPHRRDILPGARFGEDSHD